MIKDLQGTFDYLTGCALTGDVEPNGEHEHRGETEVHWDGQQTVRDPAGRPVFLDDDGNAWVVYDGLCHMVDVTITVTVKETGHVEAL